MSDSGGDITRLLHQWQEGDPAALDEALPAVWGELRRIAGHNPTPQEKAILDLIKAAPITNRHFHASDLRRAIGSAAYAARVIAISAQHGCSTFKATLVVHGQAVLEGEITR